MIKRDELAEPASCLNRAADDEPIFVLRAKDRLAPRIVREWAELAVSIHESERIDEAMRLADQMDRWRLGRYPVQPRPACPACGGPTVDRGSAVWCDRCKTKVETCCDGGNLGVERSAIG